MPRQPKPLPLPIVYADAGATTLGGRCCFSLSGHCLLARIRWKETPLDGAPTAVTRLAALEKVSRLGGRGEGGRRKAEGGKRRFRRVCLRTGTYSCFDSGPFAQRQAARRAECLQVWKHTHLSTVHSVKGRARPASCIVGLREGTAVPSSHVPEVLITRSLLLSFLVLEEGH